jgi:adenylosuccinate synthase
MRTKVISICTGMRQAIAMTVVVVIGTQWGDEGKGKVVDFYAARANMIVRFNGGNNAGHTIVKGDETFKLHLLPSGVIHSDKHIVIGNGVVVDPSVLLKEMGELEGRGYPVAQLSISDRAHMILKYHKVLDGIEERLKGNLAAGTTRRGIGPCYQDKAARLGLRMGDLLDLEALRHKLNVLVPIKDKVTKALGGEEMLFDPEGLFEECKTYAERLGSHIEDTTLLVNETIEAGQNVLFEGAQGVHLDIDHGIYPYGTSSNCIAGAACTGAGIPPSVIDEVVGVVKAYTSRVGTGPVPTELTGEDGDHLRERGGEYGTTTGRPRRCGWLDLCLVRYSHMVCGFTGLALTKLDCLGGLPTVKVCIEYKARGRTLRHPPSDMRLFAECEPQYVELDGWEDPGQEGWRRAAREGPSALPVNARKYLDFVEDETKASIAFVGVGPGRDETLDLRA